MRNATCLMVLLGVLASCVDASESRDTSLLVEAERFDDFGGWVHDCQFMDQMGSPYLLAHGLGRPVDDATTTVELPLAGTYRVLVRTRDWIGPWREPFKLTGAPGQFQLVVDGRRLDTILGAEGADWHWQAAGEIRVTAEQRQVTLALDDLTGFEGRVDAILFTADKDLNPPNSGPELAAFRRRLLDLPEAPEDVGQFDLVVVGGGVAGTCATLAAARLGLKVALVQDRPVLGGNNSSEVRVWLQGARNLPPYPRVGDIVAEMEQQKAAHYGPTNTADIYEDDKKLDLVQAEENITLFLSHRANGVEMDGRRINAVIAEQTRNGRRVRLTASWFADCTGDGSLGFLAGADHDITLLGHMGRCNLWHAVETDEPVAFPRCPWALDLSDKPFPGRDRGEGGLLQLGGWYWESGFDHDPFDKSEYIRDWNFLAMYGAWDSLKNVDKIYPNHRLHWAAHVSGKRESRRLLGEVILTKEDLLSGRTFDDGCAPTGWKMDLHLPDARYEAGFEGDAFIAVAHFTDYPRPFWIPYRCLYSRNTENLFMAGRDASVTHEALGTIRVMRTGGCMGEIVGMAAALCKQCGVDPRGVYTSHMTELKELMTRGVGRPVTYPRSELLADVGENIALAATVSTSGDRDATTSGSLTNDGRIDLRINTDRWLSHAETPNWIEFRWDEPKRIAAARIVSGFRSGGGVEAPIESFVLEIFNDGAWQAVPGTDVVENAQVDWAARFDVVVADRIRLVTRKTQTDVSRIWEVEFYEP